MKYLSPTRQLEEALTLTAQKPDAPSAPVRWGTITDLCQRYPFSRARAYRLLSAGKLSARKMGGRTIWDLDSAERYLADLPEYSTARAA